MESCDICFCEYSVDSKRDLTCGHSLCNNCYLRLAKNSCPFCRSVFEYTLEDKEEIKKLNISYSNWQPPSEISDYIPNEIISISNDSNEIYITHIPYSRVRRSMKRRRRRNLTFDEVLQKRKQIKQRCKRKFSKRNGRMAKETF